MKKLRHIAQRSLGILVIMFGAFFAINSLDHGLFLEIIDDVSALHLAMASAAILIMLTLSTSRFALINTKFGGNEDWLFLHRINTISILYSQLALPLIAQIIGRVAHGPLNRRKYYASITIVEKSIAFSIMVCLGGVTAFLLFNKFIIPPGLFLAVTFMGGAIICTVTLSYLLFFNAAERSQILGVIGKITQIGFLRIIGVSLLIQLSILLSYTILALQFVPDANIGILIGGFAIVVLATAVPISFGGWGVREAAAAAIFLALGMPPEVGVMVGLIYGILHLIILLLTVLVLGKRTKPHVGSQSPATNNFHEVNFWPVTFYLIFALLPYQIKLPIANGLITVNSVDILALIVMINFILKQLLNGTIQSIWDDRMTWIGIGGIVAMIITGWIVGYLRFSSNEWATGSRLVGLISVLSYLFVGAAMRHLLNDKLLQKVACLLAFSIICSAGIKFIGQQLLSPDASNFFNWSDRLTGFIGDPNAFSFMAGLSIILLISTTRLSQNDHRNQCYLAIFGAIIISLMALTNSRSGLGAAVILGIWLLLFLPKRLPLMLTSAAATNFIVLLSKIYSESSTPLFHSRLTNNFFQIDDARSASISIGYEMFLKYPFFGGGLGAGIQETGFVIHNLYLWILGEFGLFGSILLLPMTFAFLRTGWRSNLHPTLTLIRNTNFHGYLIFVMICGGFSLVQDIAYQRMLWLVAGFIMAKQTVIEPCDLIHKSEKYG